MKLTHKDPQKPFKLEAYKTMLNILMLHFGSSFPYLVTFKTSQEINKWNPTMFFLINIFNTKELGLTTK